MADLTKQNQVNQTMDRLEGMGVDFSGTRIAPDQFDNFLSAFQQAGTGQGISTEQDVASITPSIKAEDVGTAPVATAPRTSQDIEQQMLQTLFMEAPETPELSAEQQQAIGLFQQLEGEGADRLQLEQDFGIPEIQGDIIGIQSDIRNRLASLRAGLVSEEGRPIAQEFITGRQAQMRRLAATEIEGLSAAAQAAQGNLALAQSSVDRALGMKYEPIKARINTVNQLLEFNKENMTRAEAKLAEKKQFMLSMQERQLDRRQNLENSALSEITNAARLGMPAGEVANLMQGVLSGSVNISDALAKASKYSGLEDRLRLQQLQNQIELQGFEYADRLRQLKGTVDGTVSVSQKEAADLNKELVGSDQFQSMNMLIDSLNSLTAFEDLFNQTGVRAIGGGKASLSSKYTTALVGLKEYFNLGVLNGPDLDLLQDIVPDPTIGGLYGIPGPSLIGAPKAIARSKGIKTGLDNLKTLIGDSVDSRFATIFNQYQGYNPEQITGIKDAARKYINIKSELDPEVAKAVEKMKQDGRSELDIVQLINVDAGL